jgi:hypothetical protein
VGGTEGWILPVRLAMPVVLQNTKNINDQKETEQKDSIAEKKCNHRSHCFTIDIML